LPSSPQAPQQPQAPQAPQAQWQQPGAPPQAQPPQQQWQQPGAPPQAQPPQQQWQQPGAPPQAQPQWQQPGQPAAPAPRAGKSRTGLFIGVGAAVAAVAVVGIVLATRGGSHGFATKDDLVRETLAAITAADADRLVAAADIPGMASVIDCTGSDKGGKGYGDDLSVEAFTREARKDAQRLLDKLKKQPPTAIEVVDIADKAKDEPELKKGKKEDGCTATADVYGHRLKVKVKITDGGKPREATLKIRAMVIDDRWYLQDSPDADDFAGSGDLDAAIDQLKQFRDQACACKDAACAQRVTDAMGKWSTTMATSMDTAKPSDEQMKEAGDISSAMTECLTKAMTPAP
jgi:hypothetical protein